MRGNRLTLVLCLGLLLAGCGSAPQQTDAETRRDRLLDLNDRARRAVGTGELRRAAAYYREAVRLAESIEDFRAIAINSLNLAATLHALDEVELAHRALDRVLAAPARFDEALVAEAAGRKALLALQAGELDVAEQWLGRAEAGCRLPACRSQTALLTLRGHLQLERGSAAEARTIFARSLAASRAEGNREEEANSLRLDGRAATRAGEHGQAEAQLKQALEIDKALALPRKISQDLLALAELELARGAGAAARDYGQRALDVARASGSRSQQEAARGLLERVP